MKFFSKKHIVVTIFFIASCASTYDINSKPDGADVYDGTNKIGTTPLNISASDISNDTGGGVILRLEKSGYKHIWIWMPKGMYDFAVTINLNPFYLRSQGTSSSAISERETSRLDLYYISNILLKLQTDLLTDQPVKDDEMQNLLTANPTLGSLHFLKAVYFLSKNKKEDAIAFLKDAIRYSPKESDFLALYNELTNNANNKK